MSTKLSGRSTRVAESTARTHLPNRVHGRIVREYADSGHVQNRAVYVAIGVDLDGNKEVLELWTSSNEGAKFCLQVMAVMKNRGVQDVFIACVDGLKGLPEETEAVFPRA